MLNGTDPNAARTPARKLARAVELDAEADALVAKIADGGMTQREMQGWMYRRAWAAKLRGQRFTPEQAVAELVALGLPL
jgi:hypothetical protein